MASKAVKKANLETLASFVGNYHNNTPYRYVCQHFPDELPKPHHKFLLDLVQRCTMKPTFACLSMPPGSAKSTTLMRALAWWIANYPKDTHAYITYGQDLSWDMSRKIRSILAETAPHLEFSTNRVESWAVEQGGGLFATGIGGPLTGKRISGLLIVDDPYKNMDDARSPEYRARVSEWYKTVAMTRLQKGASAIVVHCIAGDESVPMADGSWRAMKDIVPGDELVGYDTDTHTTVPKRVTAHKKSGHAEVFEIKCDGYSVVATAEHPFLVVPKGNRKAGKLGLKYEWRKLKDIIVGDIVVGLKSFNNSSGYDYLKEIGVPADDEFGWLFGFLLGDGWTSKTPRKNNSTSWCVCCATSDVTRSYMLPDGSTLSGKDLNERCVAAMQSFFGSTPYLTKFGYYRCDDNHAGRALEELGLAPGKNAKTKVIPEWVFKAPLSFRRAVIHGLADADARKPCFNGVGRYDRSYILCSSSPDLIDSTIRLSRMSGVRASYKYARKPVWVQPPHSKAPVLSVGYTTRLVMHGIDKEAEGSGIVEDWTGTDTRLTKVRSITPVGTADVYDVTVEGTENFFPGGLCAHNTRWVESDLISELTKDHGYLYKNFPSISDNGEALWPEQYDIELLTQRRSLIGEANFSALYQGKPVADGAKVFGEPKYYSQSDTKNGWTVFVAADPAATAKSTSDFSCAVALGVRGKGADMECRIFDFLHGQWTMPEFARLLERFQRTWYGCRVGVETVNGFKAVPQMMREINPKLRILEIHPKGDKLQRALPLASAWNEGRVLLPNGAPWAATIANELTSFTGIGDVHDDIVDAMSHAFNMATAANQARTTKRGAVLDFNRYR